MHVHARTYVYTPTYPFHVLPSNNTLRTVMEHWSTIASIVSLVLYLSAILTECQPIASPMNDQFVAVTSGENITYTCTVNSGSVVWEVERSQIRSSTQFTNFADLGVIIEPANTLSISSTISIMPSFRMNNREILVQCLATQGINSIEGVVYRVITFDPPEAPRDFIIEPALTLEWSRPTNIPGPENVNVTYTITINSIEDDVPPMNYQNSTSMTSLSVVFLEEIISAQGNQCVEFEFIISATNDAGTGPSTRFIDTVPISPDVTNVDNALRVVSVELQTMLASADISFPPVQPCSPNFPLTNYTLNIDGNVSRIVAPGDVVAGVPIAVSGLTRDKSFSLTVTACNDVTCRTSIPRTIKSESKVSACFKRLKTRLWPPKQNTTDVQFSEVVFFENRLFLRCSFAGNSEAQGCIVRLTLSSTNETESFEVSHESGSLCTTANNQREAYSSVVVLDLEGNGDEGTLILNITQNAVNVTSLEQYIDLTGCRDARDNTAAIVGGVLGSIAFLLLVSVIIVVVVLFILGKQSRRAPLYRGAPPPPHILSTFRRRRADRQPAADEEKEPLTYECDVGAEDECAEKIKQHLRDATVDDDQLNSYRNQMSSGEGSEAIQMRSLPSQEDKEAWIDGHDEVDKPLTINVRLKPLVQSLMMFHSLQPGPDRRPLLPDDKDLKKVKVQLHM